MFYSVFVLGKKGPLAKVWLAAHWDKKISKAQILETNISESVDSILQPRIKLSLRTSSHLMLGVVRIYARKTQYLLQDCQDAAFKIKSAFRPDAVDLPDGTTEASIAAITLPEVLDFDLITEPPDMIDLPTTTTNVRNITITDEISSIHFDNGTGLGDDWAQPSIEHGRDGSRSTVDRTTLSNGTSHPLDIYDKPIEDDGFAGTMGVDDLDDMFAVPITDEDRERMEKERREKEGDQQPPSARPLSRMSAASDDYSAPPSMAPSNGPSTPGSVHVPGDGYEGMPGDEEPRDVFAKPSGPDQLPSSMVLDPIEGAVGFERGGRRKKRKKLGIIIDDVKTLSGEEMKAQLSDTSDILIPLDLAPPSKKLMHWKKTGGSEKLFAMPERTLHSKVLSQYYSRNLVTNRIEDGQEEEELSEASFMTNGHRGLVDDLVLDQMPPPPSPRKEGLRPAKPREKYEKEKNSPKKRARREDKENEDERRHPPKSPRGSRTPRASQVDRESARYQDKESFLSRPSDYAPDFDDHFDQPYSVGPASVGPAEEQLEDETAEQFEERVRNKRSNVLLMYLSNQLDEHPTISFKKLVKDNRRKQVAQKFYSLLVLKKQQAIELHQERSIEYGEITISAGVRYDEALSACKA